MLKSTIFREYDIRGIADTELATSDVIDLGRALGTKLKRNQGNRINLGRDCRLSSPRLHEALLEGLVGVGCEVSDIGVVPTPLLYYSAHLMMADGGVMITGSHNPAEFNGFKTVSGEGTIHGTEIQDVRRILENRDFARGHGSHRSVDVTQDYVDEISSQFDFPRRVKVVLDGGNGTAGPVAHRLFQKLNCEVTELFLPWTAISRTITRIPRCPLICSICATRSARTRPISESPSMAIPIVSARWMKTGEVIYGDMLLLIYGREILTRKPGATFIGEVKCSQVLYDELSRLGGNPIMFKTGHSLIKAKMKQEHAELAGEMSGHMFFADRYFGYDDALYAACRLIEIVSRSGQPLSAQLAGLPKMVSTPEIRVDCPDETKFNVVERVKERFRQSHKIIDVDGVRVLFEHGWGLVRASNTQPVLVLRFEAASDTLLAQYRAEVERAVEIAKEAVA